MINPPASFWQAAAAVADGLGAPRNASVLRALAAWEWCEKIHGGAGAWQWDNPLNTTEPGYGSTSTVNSAGVRVYPTEAQGVAAVVATLLNGRYPAIVAALRAGNGAQAIAQTGEIRTWGTNPSCVAEDYAAMGTPPSQYLGTITTTRATQPGSAAPGPSVFITSGTTGTSWVPWAAVAAVGVLGGVAALSPRGRAVLAPLRERVARRL